MMSQLEPNQWYLRTGSELCGESKPGRAVEHARILDSGGRTCVSAPRSSRRRQIRAIGTGGGTRFAECRNRSA